MPFKLLLVLISAFVMIGCSEKETSNTIESSPVKVSFIEDSSVNVLNPDRGLYDATYNLSSAKDYNMFEDVRANGYALVYAKIDLAEFNSTATLPNEFINTVHTNLAYAEDSGVKLIFRVQYRSNMEGVDPSKEIVSGHLEQLKQTLQEHKEVISVVQAGTIGAWGEWHAFTGDYAESDVSYKVNRREVIETLITIFPEKYIQIRTPMHKELLYGASQEYGDRSDTGKITSETAYSDETKAKIGHHNDCFLASETDMGTYASDNIVFWKAYVQNDTKFSPVGGETCAIGDGEEALLSSCTNALAELKAFQYSYLNDAYHPEVLQKWRDEGCYDEIRENLGYRLVAKTLTMQDMSEGLALTLSIENRGYAAPYVRSEVAFVLANSTQRYLFEQPTVDIRRFYVQESQAIESVLPYEGVEAGTYCLYMQIGRDYSAIRLSNAQLWDAESRTNRLACDIEVK